MTIDNGHRKISDTPLYSDNYSKNGDDPKHGNIPRDSVF